MRKEPTKGEMRAIERIGALDGQMVNYEKDLEARLRTIPDCWRQFRIAKTAIGKVLNGLYSTMPLKSLKRMKNLADHGEVVIRLRPAAVEKGLTLINDEALQTLLHICMNSECAICMRSGREVNDCELRKALMLVVPLEKMLSNDRCPYWNGER